MWDLVLALDQFTLCQRAYYTKNEVTDRSILNVSRAKNPFGTLTKKRVEQRKFHVCIYNFQVPWIGDEEFLGKVIYT